MLPTEAESLERAIHEEVALSPWDARWPAQFEAERARLMSLFPGQLIDVQHFGSTAIPGMTAKPVIDILAGVESMAVADALAGPLLQSHYTTSAGFNATLTNRRWFMRWADGRRTHHLHVVVHGGDEWQRRLRFRDALRADGALAARYGALKNDLAVLHRVDREAYTDAKTAFVAAVLGAA
ncbi:GrpB family protein [Variovorax sp. J22G21]|uniref:GrpB family protein n=1 Tax=Variovorax fucosicus TaxID=3053517 RepID=UPI0025787567|nr:MULTISPECIES: GrpB family protein [unclassified Variovorax]MDM0040509.1 GrpB family protein [Variovorax sp. J22R193]MDM0061882.1 GrpB family protein [Variovorax sp. J22G21]